MLSYAQSKWWPPPKELSELTFLQLLEAYIGFKLINVSDTKYCSIKSNSGERGLQSMNIIYPEVDRHSMSDSLSFGKWLTHARSVCAGKESSKENSVLLMVETRQQQNYDII
jgi:hypothetical protein